MKPIELPELSPKAIKELAQLFCTTRNMRLHTRAQMVLLAAEQHLVAADIAQIVRTDEQTVRRWLKRYRAAGVAGLSDAPHPGATPTVTEAYQAQLVGVARQRPRSLGLPDSLWTCQRLADYLAEQTGIRVTGETVRHYRLAADMVLSRLQHKITRPDPEYAVKQRRLKTSATI